MRPLAIKTRRHCFGYRFEHSNLSTSVNMTCTERLSLCPDGVHAQTHWYLFCFSSCYELLIIRNHHWQVLLLMWNNPIYSHLGFKLHQQKRLMVIGRSQMSCFGSNSINSRRAERRGGGTHCLKYRTQDGEVCACTAAIDMIYSADASDGLPDDARSDTAPDLIKV